MTGLAVDQMDDFSWDKFPSSEDHMVPDSSDIEDEWGVKRRHWKLMYSEGYPTMPIQEQHRTGDHKLFSGSNIISMSNSSCEREPSSLPVGMDMWNALDDMDMSKTEYNTICFEADMEIDESKGIPNEGFNKDVKMEHQNANILLGNCRGDVLLGENSIDLDSLSQYMECEGKNHTSPNILDYGLESIADFEEVDKLFGVSDMTQTTGNYPVDFSWKPSTMDSVMASKFIEKNSSLSNNVEKICNCTLEMHDCKRSLPSESPPSLMHSDAFASSRTNQSKGLSANHMKLQKTHVEIESEAKWEKQAASIMTPPRMQEVSNESIQKNISEDGSSLKNMDVCQSFQLKQHGEVKFNSPRTSMKGSLSSEEMSNKLGTESQGEFSRNAQTIFPHQSAGFTNPVNNMCFKPPLTSSVAETKQPPRGFAVTQMSANSLANHSPLKRSFDMFSKNVQTVPQDNMIEMGSQKIQDFGFSGHKHQNISEVYVNELAPQVLPQWDSLYSPEEVSRLLQTSSEEKDKLGNNDVESTILHQLQTSVSQLDIQTRLSIRDALFRLAKSAMQRNGASSTNFSGASRGPSEACNNHYHLDTDRSTGQGNIERRTNVIDRTVAYLLFHKPAELSVEEQMNGNGISSQTASVNSQVSQEVQSSSWHPSDGSLLTSETKQFTTPQFPRCHDVLTRASESFVERSNERTQVIQTGSSFSEECEASVSYSGKQSDSYCGHLQHGFESLTNDYTAQNDGCVTMNERGTSAQSDGGVKRRDPVNTSDNALQGNATSETSSEVVCEPSPGENYEEEQVTCSISPAARIMLVH